MTPERFGELVGSIAWALASDASAEEVAALMTRWDEVKATLPMAMPAATMAVTVSRQRLGRH